MGRPNGKSSSHGDTADKKIIRQEAKNLYSAAPRRTEENQEGDPSKILHVSETQQKRHHVT